jgi:hypothetical protein
MRGGRLFHFLLAIGPPVASEAGPPPRSANERKLGGFRAAESKEFFLIGASQTMSGG